MAGSLCVLAFQLQWPVESHVQSVPMLVGEGMGHLERMLDRLLHLCSTSCLEGVGGGGCNELPSPKVLCCTFFYAWRFHSTCTQVNICATDFVHRSNWVLSSSHLLTCLMQSYEHVDNAGIVSTLSFDMHSCRLSTRTHRREGGNMSSDPVVPLHTSATLHNTIRLLATRKAKSCQVSTHCAENSAVVLVSTCTMEVYFANHRICRSCSNNVITDCPCCNPCRRCRL